MIQNLFRINSILSLYNSLSNLLRTFTERLTLFNRSLLLKFRLLIEISFNSLIVLKIADLLYPLKSDNDLFLITNVPFF